MLAPDMTEVGVFGVSLKRRIAEAERKATASEAKADRLETQLHVQNLRVDSLSQNVAAAHATSNVFVVSSDEIRKVDSELPKKAEAFSRGEVFEPRTADAFQPALDEDQPNPYLVTRILENWEILAASLDLPPRRRAGRADLLRVELSPEEAAQFRRLFEEELQIVRATRNNVAHAMSIPSEDLQRAVDISDQLVRLLRNRPKPPPDSVAAG